MIDRISKKDVCTFRELHFWEQPPKGSGRSQKIIDEARCDLHQEEVI